MLEKQIKQNHEIDREQIGNFVFEFRHIYDGNGDCNSDGILKKEMGNCWQLPNDIQIVIDIGAHLGGTSILAASMGAKVYAYEPEKELFGFLKTNIELNNFVDKIHPFKLAVGDIKLGKQRKLYVSNLNSVYNAIFNKGRGARTFSENNTEIVDVISLGDIFKNNSIDYCDVLKVDCEYSEYEILTSCSPELFKKIGIIAIEIHDRGDERKALKEYLEKFYSNVGQNKDEFFFSN